jgi:YHS domain-containing protein
MNMLSTLLRILTLLLGLWLLKRVLTAILGGAGPGRPQDASGKPSQKMVKDPVCGMYMDSRLAVRLDGGEEVLYFCSEECKNKYISASSGAGKA